MFESPEQRHEATQDRPPFITDIEEAREFIMDKIRQGEKPIVTVPERYGKQLISGLKAHTTWIPELSLIAGTLGRKPYLPEGDDRIIVRVNVDASKIQPRFTGPKNAFQGVIILNGPIVPENIELLEKN